MKTLLLLLLFITLSRTQIPSIKNFQWIISHNKTQLKYPLPTLFDVQVSNANGAINIFQNRIFVAFRSAPYHFANDRTKLYVMSSPYPNIKWEYETEVFIKSDMREPDFLVINNEIHFMFFEAGTNPFSFDPKRLWRMKRISQGKWTRMETFGARGEVIWQIQKVGNTAYMTSHHGNAYDVETSLNIYFNKTTDGSKWEPINAANPIMYRGGVSEVGITFTQEGDLYGVMRNEHGDKSGFGSRVIYAKKENLGKWELYPEKSDPNIYESPRMFTYQNEVYLVARKDMGPPFDKGFTFLPFLLQKVVNLVWYSLRAHTTALYKIDKTTKK